MRSCSLAAASWSRPLPSWSLSTFESMNPNVIEFVSTEARIPAGRGYWDLTWYPWGGSFRRLSADTVGQNVEVLETYTNGTPRRFACVVAGKRCGFQF